MNILTSINEHRFLHKSNKNIPEEYRKVSFHIALERSDMNKDWKTFNELYKIAPDYLKNYLLMTSIFDYNYLKLSHEEQEKLFTVI